MTQVYWIKGRSKTIQGNIVSRVNAILGLEPMAKLIEPDTGMAIKINLSEIGYYHSLPPIVISSLFEKLREMGVKPVITDSCSLFKGSRQNGYDWTNTVLAQGLSNGEIFDNQIMQAGGYTNEEGKFWPSDGDHLGGIEIGSLLTDSEKAIVLSHVTAHPLAGLSGSIYNLAMGFLTTTGKLRVHDCIDMGFDKSKCINCDICLPFCPTGALCRENKTIHFDARICNKCLGCLLVCPNNAFTVSPESVVLFQECLVEAAMTVSKRLKGAFFINFLGSVTPQTDDHPFSDLPFIPDLGIIASQDPVAADWMTYQMITRSPGVPGSIAQDLDVLEKGTDKIKAITGTTPVHLLDYAESTGLGTRNFEFMNTLE